MIRRMRLTRVHLVAALCLLPFVALIPRLVWLQLVQNGRFDRRAQLQNMRRVPIPPQRGEIVDRDGARMAFSVADTLTPREAKQDPTAIVRMRRYYPYGASAAQVVGDLDSQGRGRGGIEKGLDDELRGHPGWATELRKATGECYLVPGRAGKPETAGYRVVLTLDADLQDIAYARLRQAVEEEHALSGVLVAVDPHTGEVLAMAGYPSFDPEAVTGSDGPNMQVKAVVSPYEPGSTFKLVTALAALKAGLFGPGTIIHCEYGSAIVGGRRVTDHEPLGALPLHSCFAHSSNIAFAKIGDVCGPLLYDTAIELGFGTPTGVGLPGESAGLVRPPEKWSGITKVSMAYGYEVMVTPLQLAMAYAAIANGGVLMRPWLVKAIEDGQGNAVYRNQPEPVHRVAEPALARTILGFMREVVTEGTGGNAELPWVAVAGKTGTAEKVINGSYSRSRHYASFVGVAPAESPRIVMLVVIDDPKSHYGGQAAAPVVREVLDAYRRLPDALLRPDYATWMVPNGDAGPGRFNPFQPEDSIAGGHETAGGTGPDFDGLPEVRGLSKREALRKLRQRGVEATAVGSGLVVEQNPAPGSPLGGPVTLTCEPGPLPRPKGDDAIEKAEAAGPAGRPLRAATDRP